MASGQFFSGGLAIFVDSFSAATDCSGFYIFARGEYFRVRQKMEKKGEIARESMSVFGVERARRERKKKRERGIERSDRTSRISLVGC